MNTRMGITTSLVVSLLLLAIIACAETAPSPTPARTEAAVGMQPTQGPTTSSQLTANDRQSPGVGPIPAPPPSPPILGEKVSLDEARRRTPYPIPIPPDGVVGADIQEVWASKEGAPTEFRQVYLIYANGLKISKLLHIPGRMVQSDVHLIHPPTEFTHQLRFAGVLTWPPVLRVLTAGSLPDAGIPRTFAARKGSSASAL